MPQSSILMIAARWSLPVLAPLAVFWSFFTSPEAFNFWVTAPTSVFETAVGVILLAAIIAGAVTFFHPATREHHFLRGWLIAWCLGLIYFAGEDLNWGQYIFNWQPPEFFLENNKELETNLHNIDSWFNQKPRQVVQLWVLLCGIIVPLGWTWPKRATAKFIPDILWADRKTLLLAILVTLVPVFEKIVELVWGPGVLELGIRPAEIQEILFAWFMLLYVLDLNGRLSKRSAEPSASVNAPAQ